MLLFARKSFKTSLLYDFKLQSSLLQISVLLARDLNSMRLSCIKTKWFFLFASSETIHFKRMHTLKQIKVSNIPAERPWNSNSTTWPLISAQLQYLSWCCSTLLFHRFLATLSCFQKILIAKLGSYFYFESKWHFVYFIKNEPDRGLWD